MTTKHITSMTLHPDNIDAAISFCDGKIKSHPLTGVVVECADGDTVVEMGDHIVKDIDGTLSVTRRPKPEPILTTEGSLDWHIVQLRAANERIAELELALAKMAWRYDEVEGISGVSVSPPTTVEQIGSYLAHKNKRLYEMLADSETALNKDTPQ